PCALDPGVQRPASARVAVQGQPPVPPAGLPQLEPVAVVHAVLHRVVVPPLALVARERDLRSVAFLLRHRALPIAPATSRSWSRDRRPRCARPRASRSAGPLPPRSRQSARATYL